MNEPTKNAYASNFIPLHVCFDSPIVQNFDTQCKLFIIRESIEPISSAEQSTFRGTELNCEMNHFEGVFVPEPVSSLAPSIDMSRLKLGEIFNNSKNEYGFVCIHCSREFKVFEQFSLHVQEHLACRFKQLIDVKVETTVLGSRGEIQDVANGDFQDQSISMNQDETSDYVLDSDADYFGDNNSKPKDADKQEEEKFFNPKASNPDDLARMNGLINSYCSADRTIKNYMNPDEYRPLVAGVDYEKRDGKFVCLRCHKSVSKSSTLRHHLASHRKTKYYGCPLCDKSFIAIENIQKHISRVHRKVYSRNIIREAQLLKKAEFPAFLKKYEEQKAIKMQYEYECYKCRKILSSLTLLKRHLSYHDKSEKRFQLGAYVNESARGRVQQIVKPVRMEVMRGNKKYRKCVACDKYYTINYYREHMLTHNKEHKRFVCEICGSKFLVAPQLRKHMVMHEQDRRFKCDICPAAYTRSPALIRHRRTHSEPLPFGCNVCGKGYYLAQTLQAHMGKHEIKHIN